MIVNGTDETHVPLNPMLYLDGPTEFIVHSMGKYFTFRSILIFISYSLIHITRKILI